jgi:putative SOS response-associated peptidase YedK
VNATWLLSPIAAQRARGASACAVLVLTSRHCIVPVDGFFEWKAIKGQRAKQPYAIAMKDGAPVGIAGIRENWKEPSFGGWIQLHDTKRR